MVLLLSENSLKSQKYSGYTYS